MEALRDFAILLLEKFVETTRFVKYLIFLSLTPILEFGVKRALEGFDIRVNGARAWDLEVLDRKFYARFCAYGSLALAEGLMQQQIRIHDLEAFSFRLGKHGGLQFWYSIPSNKLLHYLRWNSINLQTKDRASKSCNPHYNLGSDFFDSFLDESLTYSVAYWSKASDLSTAQKHKMEVAAQKLQLKPGMRVLDLGCGFGSLGKYLAEHYNVDVVGITNSTKMGEEAGIRCEGHSVEIQVTDWRDLEGKFDRVVCIEMILHVGRHNLKEFFRKVNSWLKEDGLFVMQDFGMEHGCANSDDFVCKYFFPAVYVGTVEEILETSRGQLAFEHFEDMTLDLVKTDRALWQSFQKRWPKIAKQYDERFYEAMRFYFNFGAGLASARVFLAYQMVFRKVSIGPLQNI